MNQGIIVLFTMFFVVGSGLSLARLVFDEAPKALGLFGYLLVLSAYIGAVAVGLTR